MTSHIPYPPPPEPGWYDDDSTVLGQIPVVSQDGASADASADAPAAVQERTGAEPQHVEARASGSEAIDDASQDWDSTVLSPSFTMKEPEHRYRLHNESTGQTVVLEKSTLLGRKPSQSIPEGATSVTLADPTRTISRNHAAVSFDKDGALWIEDYGSLNGTFLIVNGEESQVVKGTPVKVSVPCTVRIGDQFFSLEEA
ncbi:FHA domain-containing protein [Bifidobacterium sp. SMB2]|uniref:FHA domain-containing protein n=1 Tax=Bifidobacterium saimiriisciurei TaxID=2661627 RepID=A0ABX0CIX4_9BIFI|nr:MULTISPECIES: FHA domain-containing protein [Bifidobacterium]NEG96754.1 FHA domain-containing protein [Bifidobacterium sp. SMB2]NEH12320.1 FHA domain-containing protein [Bifidobacterium saimiriisciurei]